MATAHHSKGSATKPRRGQRKPPADTSRQDQLRALIEALPMAVYTTDADGWITMFNQAAVDFAGRVPEIGKDRYCIAWKLYTLDGMLLPLDRSPMALALRRGTAVPGEELIAERPDGSRATFIPFPTPLRDASGNVIGGVNMLVDISDRKEAEFARARLSAIVESSNDAIVSKDLNGIINSWNEGAQWLFGYTAEEAIGRSITMIIPSDRADEEQRILQRIRAGMRVEHFETLRRRKDGSLVNVSVTISPVRDASGRIIGASKIARDISERKLADGFLTEARDRLASELRAMTALHQATNRCSQQGTSFDACLEELLTAAIVVTGADRGNLQLFDEASKTLMLTANRGFQTPFLDFFAAVRDEPSACCVAMRDGKPVAVADVTQSPIFAGTPALDVLLKAGVRAIQSTPLIGSAGELLGVISTHFNQPHELSESERRRMDLVARQAANFIERKRAEETLRRSEEALKEADRRKDEFLATLAHELRNPLAPIKNAVELLRVADGNRESLEQTRAMLERQVGQLQRLVDDLFDVSRISRGKVELHRERVELGAVIRSATEVCRSAVAQMNHELSVALPPEPLYVDADPIRLSQMLANLLNNACKYTEPGGRISLSAVREGTDVVISVKDNGIGIAPEKLPHLFTMFFQADHSLERSQGGLGIGLSIVHRLAQLHGGSVHAHSAGAGQGSEFVVRLPGAAEQSVPEASRADSARTPRGRRILVADDNRDAASSLCTLLTLVGNEVCAAYDGLEAIEAAASFRPDVVLLDIGMPKLNGYETCRRLRQQPGGAGTLLIALTGWGQDDDRRRTREAGFDAHLVKPVDLAQLTDLLSSLGAGRLRAAAG